MLINKEKYKLLNMLKEYTMYNIPIRKQTLKNSLHAVGLDLYIYDEDRAIIILENNKRIFEISYIYDAKLKSTIRLYEIEAIKTTKVNVIKYILNRRFNCKNHLIQKGGYYNEIK